MDSPSSGRKAAILSVREAACLGAGAIARIIAAYLMQARRDVTVIDM